MLCLRETVLVQRRVDDAETVSDPLGLAMAKQDKFHARNRIGSELQHPG